MAGNVDIGALVASLGMDTSEFMQALQDADNQMQDTSASLSAEMEKIGQNMQSVGKSLSMFVTLPLLAAGVASFKMASDVEESINKVNVAFKGSANEVLAWGDTTLEAYGIAKGSALDMSALFGDMATSMGLVPKQAANMSMSLVGLAGDMASFKNVGIDEVQTALAGIFTGETESLKRLGIVMTEATLDAYALAKGFGKTTKEMDQQEKVLLRYQYVMDATTNSQGDFSRTQDGAANQMRIFQESIKEVSASLGSVLLPIFTPILQRVNSLLKWLGSLSDTQKRWVVGIAATVAAIGPMMMIVGKIIAMYKTWVVVIQWVRSAMIAMNAVLASNPYGLLLIALAGAAAYLLTFSDNTNTAATAQWKLGDAVEETNKELGKQVATGVFKNVKTELVETAAGLRTFQEVSAQTMEQVAQNMKKLTPQELESLKLYLEEELQKALRATADATDEINKTIESNNVTQYQQQLQLVAAELAKVQEFTNTVNGLQKGSVGILQQLNDQLETYKKLEKEATTEEGLIATQEKIALLESQIQKYQQLNAFKKLNIEMDAMQGKGAVNVTQTPESALKYKPVDSTKLVQKDMREMTAIMVQHDVAMEKANQSALLFGDSYDYLGEKLAIVNGTVQSLIDNGYGLEAQTAGVVSMQKELTAAHDKMLLVHETFVALQSTFQQGFNALGTSLVDSLGLATDGFEGFISGLAKTIIQLISMFLSQSLAAAIAGASTSAAATGPAAIVTGPAFIATAIGGVLAAFAAIPKFADGGLVYGPTVGMMGEYPGANANPEVIAPLDTLRSMITSSAGSGRVVFEIAGRNLKGVLLNEDKHSKAF